MWLSSRVFLLRSLFASECNLVTQEGGLEEVHTCRPALMLALQTQSLWVSLEYSLKIMELRRELMDVFRGLVPIYLPKQKEW